MSKELFESGKDLLPQKPNKALVELFKKIPTRDVRSLDGTVENIAAELTAEKIIHSSSSQKESLTNDARRYLKYSNTTQSFQQYFLDNFSDVCVTGRFSDDTFPEFSQEILEHMLDVNYPESKGIFDPERGKSLETYAYTFALKEHLQNELYLMNTTTSSQNPNKDSLLQELTVEVNKGRSFLRKWHQDYREKYDTDPITLED